MTTLSFLVLAALSPAHAAEGPAVITLDSRTTSMAVLPSAWQRIDPGGKADLGQIVREGWPAMHPSRLNDIYRLGPQGALWLGLRVKNTEATTREWVLSFPDPLLDLVVVYAQDARGTWSAQTSGDTLAAAQWSSAGRHPWGRILLQPGETRELRVRVQHVHPLSLSPQLVPELVFEQDNLREYLGFGVIYGALLILIAACAAQGLIYRDRVYAWYAGYGMLMALAVGAYTGLAAHLLWPQSGWWADRAPGCLTLLAASAALLFVGKVSSIGDRLPWLLGLIRVWSGASLLMAAAYLMLDREQALPLLLGSLLGSCALAVWASAVTWRRGDKVGLWLLLAYAPLAASMAVTIARVAGLLHTSLWTQYGIVLAMLIEVPLMLLALNLRSRDRHAADVREQALSSQDALTGLLAAHFFNDRLRQAVARHRRDGASAALVYIDLVNYRHIRDMHGQAIADQSLVRSVIKLRRLLRDVDTLGRIGEARFGLIMEGIHSRAVVTDRAARLIASGLMPLAGLQPEVTLIFHTSCVLLDEHNDEPDALQEALSGTLASMSSRTRRPIRFVEPHETHPMPLEAHSTRGSDFDSVSQR